MEMLKSLSDEQIKSLLASGFSFKHRTLEEYIEYFGKPLKASEEYNWGKTIGREVW